MARAQDDVEQERVKDDLRGCAARASDKRVVAEDYRGGAAETSEMKVLAEDCS